MQKEGVVKFFNAQKGFGFIIQSHSRYDIFFHSSGLIDQVSENDRVMYETTEGDKGVSAINVELM